tara:strand:+ start:681 stop:956 length:276 start_codon:yes stop_codon:yes gene_type:complete
MVKVVCPLMGHSGKSHHLRGTVKGKGIGTMLLDGGIGGGSSYESVDDYIATTGRNPEVSGSGVKKDLSSKLEKLVIMGQNSQKPKNIKFKL